MGQLLRDHAPSIDDVVVTLDSHQRMHIAHGLFWRDAEGAAPAPFTVISRADVEAGTWRPARPEHRERALHYVRELERSGRFQLCIWPEHCVIGSPGHCVTPPVLDGLRAWTESRREAVEYVLKGQCQFTEMYSALRAEVAVPGDPATGLNQALIERLSKRERVLVCGQAQSHCVQFTVRDLLEHWPRSERHRIWLLDDCMSNVPGFEAAGEAFIADMKAAGLTVVPAAEAFAEPLPLQELGANEAPQEAATAPAVAASGAG